MVQFKRIIHDYNLELTNSKKIPKGQIKKKIKIRAYKLQIKKKKVLCDYTIGKYKKKMCYPQKNNSWLQLLKFVN